jgi:hypothetical protein
VPRDRGLPGATGPAGRHPTGGWVRRKPAASTMPRDPFLWRSKKSNQKSGFRVCLLSVMIAQVFAEKLRCF